MRVLLLQPNYDSHVVHPPLGLGYLAAFLEEKGYSVTIYDGTLKNATLDDYLLAVKKFEPDLVGISVLTRGHNKTKEMIKALKRKFPKIPIVIGGTQVTAAPKEVISDLKADFGVIGEGEITLLELVKELEKGKKNFAKIDGLVYKTSGGKLKINSPRELIKDLDNLPFPAWDLMLPKEYRIAPILEPAHAFPIAPVLTSRGCPYNCSFCASNVTWQRRLRFRSIANVLDEIKMLKDKLGVKEIHFCDDNFTMDIKRAEKMCDALITKKINIPWQCPNGVRIDRLTLPLLKKMRKAGCYAVGLGIESGNQDMLKSVNKQLDLRLIPKVLENLKKVGIESYGFFILGLPGETKKTSTQTIDFALKNSFDRAWFSIFTPYPGSPAFVDWIKDREFSKIDWDEHDCATAIMAGEDLTPGEIEKLQKEAIRKFYLRPKVFFRVLSHLGPKEITTFLMSRFFSHFAKPLFLITHRLVRKKK